MFSGAQSFSSLRFPSNSTSPLLPENNAVRRALPRLPPRQQHLAQHPAVLGLLHVLVSGKQRLRLRQLLLNVWPICSSRPTTLRQHPNDRPAVRRPLPTRRRRLLLRRRAHPPTPALS